MQVRVSIHDANQHLSRYLESVEQGNEVIFTRRGKPIAKLVKTSEPSELTPEQRAARERLRNKLSKGYSLGGIIVERESIYDRD